MGTLSDNRIKFEEALNDLLAGFEPNTSGGIGGGGTVPAERVSSVNYVKAKLNELIPEGEGITFSLSDEPNVSNPLDLLINAHLDECVKDICLTAPLNVLYPTEVASQTGTPLSSGNTAGYVVLPTDFLRLSVFKMTDWTVELRVAKTIEDPSYKKQGYKFLKSGTKSPQIYLNWVNVPSVGLRRVIEYYSISTLHTVSKLFYIAEKAAEDFVEDNPHLLDSLAWQCASKILQILSLGDLSKVAQERVMQSYINQ